MRKPPLIALSAFTALGASVIAGTTAGLTHISLTSATHAVPSRRSTPKAGAAGDGIAVRGGRDLRALHDPELTGRRALSNATGLPARPKPKPRKAALVSATKAAPESAPAPPPPPAPPSGGVWYELRSCESGDNYATDTGNGYYGAYQFSLSTWYGLGYSGLPSEASPAVQDEAAAELQELRGWDQWPQCAAELGLY